VKGTNHEKTNYISGTLFLFLALRFNIPHLIILYFLYGLCALPLWYNCDNDKENSRSIKRWGPFKRIWKPFWKAGHREVLHTFTWGPIILCVIPGMMLMPYVWHSQDFSVMWMLAGLCVATWLHILTDTVSAIKNIPKIIKRKLMIKLGFHHRKKHKKHKEIQTSRN
jgi:uncharacterized metal-binding protein